MVTGLETAAAVFGIVSGIVTILKFIKTANTKRIEKKMSTPLDVQRAEQEFKKMLFSGSGKIREDFMTNLRLVGYSYGRGDGSPTRALSRLANGV